MNGELSSVLHQLQKSGLAQIPSEHNSPILNITPSSHALESSEKPHLPGLISLLLLLSVQRVHFLHSTVYPTVNWSLYIQHMSTSLGEFSDDDEG
jgi:hypothetical protein